VGDQRPATILSCQCECRPIFWLALTRKRVRRKLIDQPQCDGLWRGVSRNCKSRLVQKCSSDGGHTTSGFSHRDIIELYRQGMSEAVRVLRADGQLWVKTMDEIESGRQRRSHIEIHTIAGELGLRDRDLFVLTPPPIKTARWRRQHHAHKAHSFLWIFDRH
jgi:hypothetical protein